MKTKTNRVATCDICGCAIKRYCGDIMVKWEPTYEEMHEAARCEESEDGQRFLCERCAAADCIDGDDDCMATFWVSNLRAEHPGAEVIGL